MRRYLTFIFCTLVLTACLTPIGNIHQPTPSIDVVAIQTNAAATAYARFTEITTTIPIPTMRPTATIPPTAPRILEPTLIPTINPEKIPNLLQSSLLVEKLESFNGHSLLKVTGWGNGFNTFDWLNEGHLLLFPITGQASTPNFGIINDLQPAVINLSSGKLWLPPSDRVTSWNYLNRGYLPRWSPKLGALITAKTTDLGSIVSTYDSNGNLITNYQGNLVGISPSGTKILINGDTWIDLDSKKSVNFAWGHGIATERWSPIWSLDETQVYQCCYFYGNTKTGQSYSISDESTILDGHQDNNMQSLHHSHGVWLNDNYVMAQFDGFFTYRDGPIPIFDISAKTFRNLGVVASLSDEFNTLPYTQTRISPNRKYMWVYPGLISGIDPKGYLINLRTLKSQLYHYGSLSWSANGEYAILDSQILTLADMSLHPIPSYPNYRYLLDEAWHPFEGIRASILASDDKQQQTLFMLNAKDLTLKKIALPPVFSSGFLHSIIFWSPDGKRIALLARDGSLWKIDYPSLNGLEQLTPSIPEPVPAISEGIVPLINNITWSPDGKFLAFIDDNDIYIVDIQTKP